MNFFQRLLQWLFPARCVLCRQLLRREETDLCHNCRLHGPDAPIPQKSLPNLDRWVAVWYYERDVRHSILRFKFQGARAYALTYGRLIAMLLLRADMTDFDILTWVPISPLRRLRRGYDQVALIARAVGREMGVAPVPLLKKRRHTPAQSGLSDAAARRANVLGAYQVRNPAAVDGQRVLLLDDVITTGATAGECAKMLRLAGAKTVNCVAVARRHDIYKKQ